MRKQWPLRLVQVWTKRSCDLESVHESGGRAILNSRSAESKDLSTSNAHEVSPSYTATFDIAGMSCSSCVGKITTALKNVPWIHSVDVSFLSQTAILRLYKSERTDDVLELMKALGYEAMLQELQEIVPNHQDVPKAHLWRATLRISGMTCSSCVGSVTNGVQQVSGVIDVNVNLINGSAAVIITDKHQIEEVLSAIDQLGFDATLEELVDPNEKDNSTTRTVSLHIEGLICNLCPPIVLQILDSLDRKIHIISSPTLESPIVTFSYEPDASSFTIRHIISQIAAAKETFQVTIYHPPTLEERARKVQEKVRRRLLYRILLAFVASIPALIIGVIYMNLVSETNATARYFKEPLKGVSRANWALLALATPVYFFSADVFHRRAIRELIYLWRPSSVVPILERFYKFGSMDMLIFFATTIAYISSIVEIIIAASVPSDRSGDTNATYLDAVIFLTLFLLIGRVLEAYSKAKTGEAVSKLGSLRPQEALLLTPTETGDYKTQVTAIASLESGDLVRVAYGASPPWDGIVLEGSAEFIESGLTGESKPVSKGPGDIVYSGTVNRGGSVMVRITGAGGTSMLDQIIKVVREGQSHRAPIERLADVIKGYFVPFVTLVAVSTWTIWLVLGESGVLPRDYLDVPVGSWPFWSLRFAIAVFVIACPCGIGLAAPTALFVGGGLAAEYGILAQGGGEAFQETSILDVIVFDKTGTLTQGGDPKITNHTFFDADPALWDEEMILGCLGDLEGSSTHPIATAISAFCATRKSLNVQSIAIQEIPGKGMKGRYKCSSSSSVVEIITGNEALMKDHDVELKRQAMTGLDHWRAQGMSIALVAGRIVSLSYTAEESWTLLYSFCISDPLREESREVVKLLQGRGLSVWMLSGDNQKTANAVGEMVGIPPDHIIAGVLPDQKAEKIEYLQQIHRETKNLFGYKSTRRSIVGMVGDGVNDAPALTIADVSIAIGTGSDIAISSAQFVLINSNLHTLVTLLSLSQAVLRRVKFNFGWAMVYNLIALPIAAGVLYPIVSNGTHTRLDPVWASLAMALSSISVITSSLLLRTRIPWLGFRIGKLSRKIEAGL